MLRAWVKENSLRGETASLTHVFLDGGKAVLPLMRRRAFLEVYAQAVVSPQDDAPLCVVERTYATYRMFADMDLKISHVDALGPSSGSENVRSRMDALLRRALSLGLPAPLRRLGPVTVCASFKDAAAAGTKLGGFHLVFENAYVDDETAMGLRNLWVANLAASDSSIRWGEIVDAAVYKRSGLRMPWSFKANGDINCYTPYCTVRFGDAEEEEGGQYPIELEYCKESSPSLDGVREWLQRSTLNAGMGFPKSPCLSSVASASAASAASSRPSSAVVDLSERQRQRLRAALPACYAGVAFPAVLVASRKSSSSSSRSLIIRTDSRVCGIAGREHSSNHVYLVAMLNGPLFQCCFSPKCAGRRKQLRASHPLDSLVERAIHFSR